MFLTAPTSSVKHRSSVESSSWNGVTLGRTSVPRSVDLVQTMGRDASYLERTFGFVHRSDFTIKGRLQQRGVRHSNAQVLSTYTQSSPNPSSMLFSLTQVTAVVVLALSTLTLAAPVPDTTCQKVRIPAFLVWRLALMYTVTELLLRRMGMLIGSLCSAPFCSALCLCTVGPSILVVPGLSRCLGLSVCHSLLDVPQ